MNETFSYPADAGAFESVMRDIASVILPEARLPEWPFRAPSAFAYFRMFGGVLEGRFEPLVQSLVSVHGDETVSFAVIDPAPEYYRQYYASYPVFRAPAHNIGETYWELVSYRQGGRMTGAVIDTADTFAVTGSSKRWAVWAEREWGLGIVISDIEDGPWTASAGVTFLSAEEALVDRTEPEIGPLPKELREEFLKNVRERGSDRER